MLLFLNCYHRLRIDIPDETHWCVKHDTGQKQKKVWVRQRTTSTVFFTLPNECCIFQAKIMAIERSDWGENTNSNRTGIDFIWILYSSNHFFYMVIRALSVFFCQKHFQDEFHVYYYFFYFNEALEYRVQTDLYY